METLTPERIAAAYLVGLDRKTRDGYRRIILDWYAWCGRNSLKPMNVRRLNVEVWIATMLEIDGLARRTVAGRITVIAGLYDYAHYEGWIEQDPCARVRRPRLPRASTGSWLTRDQLRAFLTRAAAHPEPAVAALAHLLALNGTRIAETLALNIADIGRHGQMTTIRLDRKGLKPGQIISLAEPTALHVRRAAGDRASGPLLLNLDGQRMTAPTARHIIGALGEAAGADRPITPHSLRRTFVTLSRDAGVPDRDIMASGGWLTPGMIDYYDRQRAAVERNATHRLVAWLDETTS